MLESRQGWLVLEDDSGANRLGLGYSVPAKAVYCLPARSPIMSFALQRQNPANP